MSKDYYFRDIQKHEQYQIFIAKLAEKEKEIIQIVEESFPDEDFDTFSIRNTFINLIEDKSQRRKIGTSLRVGGIAYISKEYKDIKTMKEWFDKNKEKYVIVSEYDQIITWDELVKELFSEKVKWEYGDYYYDLD